MRAKSVVVERRSRSRSRLKNKASHLSSNSNVSSGERSLATALRSIRDKFTTQKSVSSDLTQEASFELEIPSIAKLRQKEGQEWDNRQEGSNLVSIQSLCNGNY